MHGSRNGTSQFFQKIKRMSEGFKSAASFCKDQYGNMVTDIKRSLERAHFNATLNCDDTNNPANGHWKACQGIGVLVCSAHYLKRAMLQSAAIIVA